MQKFSTFSEHMNFRDLLNTEFNSWFLFQFQSCRKGTWSCSGWETKASNGNWGAKSCRRRIRGKRGKNETWGRAKIGANQGNNIFLNKVKAFFFKGRSINYKLKMIGTRIELQFSMKITLHSNRIVWFCNFVDYCKMPFVFRF